MLSWYGNWKACWETNSFKVRLSVWFHYLLLRLMFLLTCGFQTWVIINHWLRYLNQHTSFTVQFQKQKVNVCCLSYPCSRSKPSCPAVFYPSYNRSYRGPARSSSFLGKAAQKFVSLQWHIGSLWQYFHSPPGKMVHVVYVTSSMGIKKKVFIAIARKNKCIAWFGLFPNTQFHPVTLL